MTYKPKSLDVLEDYWKANGGVALGVVGDPAHASRQSYHNGRDRIIKRCGTTDPVKLAACDYSVRQPRDRQPTDAAMGIDFGRLNGTLTNLYAFSRWLVKQCLAGAPGSEDVREVIYSPDGKNVQRWSGVDNAIHTGPGNGDPSHIGHSHVSYYRDSEKRDKLALITPYFEEDEEMRGFTLSEEFCGDVLVTIDGASALRLDDEELIPVKKGELKKAIGYGKLMTDLGTGSGAQADRKSGWLLYGTRPAWLLAYAGREVPQPAGGDITHSVVLRVDENVVFEGNV